MSPYPVSSPTTTFSSPTSTKAPQVARVQKIIHADPERLNVSKNAAFAIALATEMFIQHLATTTHNVVKTERKPRRNIQYRDVSSAIAKTDNLEFAVDVVPKTVVWKEAKKKKEEREEREKEREGKDKAEREADSAEGGAEESLATNGHVEEGIVNGNGMTASSPTSEPATLSKPDRVPDAMDVDDREDSEPEDDAAAMQLEMEMRGPPRPKTQTPEPVEVKPQPPPVPAPTVTTRRSAGGFTSINGSK
jgi:DNA polymerase epsilon subunit 4